MSWTVIDDNDVLQVRASIATAEELDKVIAALERRRDKFKPPLKTDSPPISSQQEPPK